jgi:hypothetical protein
MYKILNNKLFAQETIWWLNFKRPIVCSANSLLLSILHISSEINYVWNMIESVPYTIFPHINKQNS